MKSFHQSLVEPEIVYSGVAGHKAHGLSIGVANWNLNLTCGVNGLKGSSQRIEGAGPRGGDPADRGICGGGGGASPPPSAREFPEFPEFRVARVGGGGGGGGGGNGFCAGRAQFCSR